VADAEFLELRTRRDGWAVYVKPRSSSRSRSTRVQESSQYPGGLALRFARVKAYRPDKRPEEADTVDTVRRVYQRRSILTRTGKR
jgi:DNA ligase-1